MHKPSAPLTKHFFIIVHISPQSSHGKDPLRRIQAGIAAKLVAETLSAASTVMSSAQISARLSRTSKICSSGDTPWFWFVRNARNSYQEGDVFRAQAIAFPFRRTHDNSKRLLIYQLPAASGCYAGSRHRSAAPSVALNSRSAATAASCASTVRVSLAFALRTR